MVSHAFWTPILDPSGTTTALRCCHSRFAAMYSGSRIEDTACKRAGSNCIVSSDAPLTWKNLGKEETEINRLFNNSHNGFHGKILTQIKLNLSPLKFHLFKYNLTDNPFCPSCGDSVETPIHYFIECNTHRANHQIMIQNLLK